MEMNYHDLIRGDRSEWLGRFRIDEYLIEKDRLKKGHWQKNLITDLWKEQLALVTTGTYEVNKITIAKLAVGTDDTAPNAADTSLGSQIGDLKSAVAGSVHNNTTANIAQSTFFFESTESAYYETWNELGLYATNGTTMLTHSLIDPAVTFNVTKTINVYYEVEF